MPLCKETLHACRLFTVYINLQFNRAFGNLKLVFLKFDKQ